MCFFIVNSENALFTVNVYDVYKLCSDDCSDECCTLLPTRVHVSRRRGVRVSARVCISPRVRVSPHAHTSVVSPQVSPRGGVSPRACVSPRVSHLPTSVTSPHERHISPRESPSISPRKSTATVHQQCFPFARAARAPVSFSACQRLASRVDWPRLGLRLRWWSCGGSALPRRVHLRSGRMGMWIAPSTRAPDKGSTGEGGIVGSRGGPRLPVLLSDPSVVVLLLQIPVLLVLLVLTIATVLAC